MWTESWCFHTRKHRNSIPGNRCSFCNLVICDLQKQVAATSASDVFLERVYRRLSGRPKKVGSAVFIAVDFMDARMSEP